MASAPLSSIWTELQHDQQLVRSKGQSALKTLLESRELTPAEGEALQTGVVGLLAAESVFARLGGFLAATLAVPYFRDAAAFRQELQRCCVANLESLESRVRLAVGDCLGTLASADGVSVYGAVGEAICDSIGRNFERDDDTPCVPNDDPLESLLATSYRVTKPGTGEMRHGTEGWKALETSYRALLKIVENTGPAFETFVTEDLWSLVFRGVQHPNRFVREMAYFTVGALTPVNPQDNVVEVVAALAKGLGDDWSQVRYAASVATRRFALHFKEMAGETLVSLFPAILPQMCLNRYYVAEGVRLYSQETWKMIVGDEGRQRVAQSAAAFVDYYTRQCGANNHAVREAACSCIAELMTKVDRSAVEPHVPKLLQALVNCFKDASWPVRDAACCACGKCVLAFPEPSKAVLDEIYTLWLAHLADNIASVREDSAVALGDAVRAYGAETLIRILPEIRAMLPRAKDQAAESVQFSGLRNVTQFGVAGPKGTDAKHTDQTMFSCGSLAPKLERGGGCMDHGFKRPKELWEESDGAVYFVRELSGVDAPTCLEFLPQLTELLYLRHFAHAANLHETIWKALPVVAQNLGKRRFKPYLNEMLTPLFRSVQSDHALEAAAATQAAQFFSEFLGEGIFRGRLNEEQRRVLDTLHGPHQLSHQTGM